MKLYASLSVWHEKRERERHILTWWHKHKYKQVYGTWSWANNGWRASLSASFSYISNQTSLITITCNARRSTLLVFDKHTQQSVSWARFKRRYFKIPIFVYYPIHTQHTHITHHRHTAHALHTTGTYAHTLYTTGTQYTTQAHNAHHRHTLHTCITLNRHISYHRHTFHTHTHTIHHRHKLAHHIHKQYTP